MISSTQSPSSSETAASFTNSLPIKTRVRDGKFGNENNCFILPGWGEGNESAPPLYQKSATGEFRVIVHIMAY